MSRFATLIILCALLAPATILRAEVGEEINARLLPTVWYSTLAPAEEESVEISAGIQNDSGRNFAGLASFLVDGEIVGEVEYESARGSLIEVSSEWLAEGGAHKVVVRITTDLPADVRLVAYESEESELKVARKITLEEAREGAVKVAERVVETIDRLANSLAEKLESNEPDKLVELEDPEGSVLSASTGEGEAIEHSGEEGSQESDGLAAVLLAKGQELLALLIRKWRWTLSIGALLILLWSFRAR